MNPIFQKIIDKDCIVVASAHHTGTWFALNFLLGLEGINGVDELRTLIDGKEPQTDHVVHFHLTGETIHSRGLVEFLGLEHAVELLSNVRSIIPLRDPVSSLISRDIRHPELDHHFIIDSFIFMDKLPSQCFFLPVDLYQPFKDGIHRYSRNELRTTKNRLMVLKDLCQYINFEFSDHVSRYANEWPASNTRGDYALKILYEKHQDLRSVSSFFKPEYEYLLNNKNKIIPFLKSKGYKNLPWYREVK